MKYLFAAALALGLSGAAAAAEATADPKLDFLGYCITQGSSSSYCACVADKLGAALTPAELAVYNDYLRQIGAGQQDAAKLIDELTARHGISKKDLGRILKAATDITANPETCAGL